MVLASSFLGLELEKRMNERSAKMVVLRETVSAEMTASHLGVEDPEEAEWIKLAPDALLAYQVPRLAKVNHRIKAPILAVRNLERYGYVDDLLFVSKSLPEGLSVDVEVNEYLFQALVVRPTQDLQLLIRGQDTVLGGVSRLAPLMGNGFSRTIFLPAESLVAMERAHRVSALMQNLENRKIYAQSGLEILKKIQEVQEIQTIVLWAATIGSSLVLGLVCGALAWMEFREERYLLSLIRSFGVGRGTLLLHAILENCLLTIGGIFIGYGFLNLMSNQLDLQALNLIWLRDLSVLHSKAGQVLLVGAVAGGILSCVPVAIGLRKPLGLVLK